MSQQINLFNPIFLRQKKYFSARAMVQALGLVLLGAVLVYGYALREVQELEQQSVETAKRYAGEQNKLARFATEFSPQQANRLLEERVRKTEAQLAAQQGVIDALKSGAIGNVGGYSEYLRAFARQVVPGLWLTGFTITGDGSEISLSGGVLNPGSLPDYIRRLKREKVMQGKTFASLQMRQPKAEGEQRTGRYVEFVLRSAEANGSAK